MPPSPRRVVVPAVLLLVALPRAQETAVPPPADAPRTALHLHVAGPAVWRRDLGPTNLGGLLASEQGQQLLQPLVDPLEQLLQQLLGGAEGYAAARRRALDFAGSLELALAFTAAGDPILTARFVGDGSTDLAALAGDVFATIERTAGRPAGERRVGDGTVRVVTLPDGSLVGAPRVGDGDAITVAAPEREFDAAWARALSSPPAAGRGPLSLRFDLPAVRDRVVAELGEGAAVYTALGFDSLDHALLELGAAGPHVRIDVSAQFAGDDRGLFGAFFPSTTGLSPLALVHPAGGGYKAGRFDALALLKTVRAAIRASGDVDAETTKELDAQIDGPFFAQLTDEYLLFGGRLDARDPDDPDDADEALTLGIAFRVRDQQALREAWVPLRKEWGFTAATEERDGVTFDRLGGFLPSHTTVAIGRGLFAVAFGPDAGRRLDELFAACGEQAKPADAAPVELRDLGFGVVQRHAPAGLNGVGATDVRWMLLQVLTGLATIGEATGIDLPGRSAETDVERVAALLKQHGLDQARSMTGFADRRWLFRVLW